MKFIHFLLVALCVMSVQFYQSQAQEDNNATTLEPPTTTAKTTTTTVTTTTTQVTTTTTAPPADIPTGNFTVQPCLMVLMSAVFYIDYKTTVNTTKTQTFIVPATDAYNGTCDTLNNTLAITFEDPKWTFNLMWSQLPTDAKSYELSQISLDYAVNAKYFPDAAAADFGAKNASLTNLTLYSTTKDQSYRCNANETVQLSSTVRLVISHFQAQPFMKSADKFATAAICPADQQDTNKIVPIVVGSALALLVILVLIAYVIGRRKHRPGYQQV